MTGGGALESAEAGAFADAVEAERVGVGADRVKELLSLKLKKASWSGLSGVMTSEPLTVTIARPLYEPVVVPGVDPHGGTEIVSARAIEAASAVAMAITIERARTDRNAL